MEATRVCISTNENPTYIQFWPLVATAWKRLGFEPSLALVTDRPESEWEWMKEYGEIVRYPENREIPAVNWAKMVRWSLYCRYEDEISFCSDVDMLPLQREYFAEMPEGYNPEKHLIIKGTYDMSKTGKFPGCYMTATGALWRKLLKIDEFPSFSEWVKQHYDSRIYDDQETVNKQRFSEESLMRKVVLQWDAKGENTIRLPRPGGWLPELKSTCLRVDRSMWPQGEGWKIMGFSPDSSYPDNPARPDHPAPHEGYYIDAHMLRPLETAKDHIYPLADYLGIDRELILIGIHRAQAMQHRQ
tara:strand:- start:346 stop:1248 length:903 start_codon:yes stop_codon:yes gene_type:complete